MPGLPCGVGVVSIITSATVATRLAEGDEFTAITPPKGKRVRMAFRRYVLRPSGACWIDAWDGRQLRSVHLEAVVRVHRTRKLSGGASCAR